MNDNTNIKFPQIFSAIRDVVIIFDKQGRYINITPTNPEYLFKPVEEMQGKTVHEVLSKELAGLFDNAIKKSLRQKESVLFQYQIPVEEKKLWFDARISPLNEENVVFVGRNITELMEEQKRVAESEAKLRAIFDNSQQAFLIISKQFQIKGFNRAAQILSQELFGKKLSESTDIREHITDMKVFYQSLNKVYKGEKLITESQIKGTNGKKYWFEIRFAPVFEGKKISGVFVSLADITQRKQYEVRLHKSKANLKAMFDGSPQVYHLIDKNYCLLSYNKQAFRFYKNIYKKELAQEKSILEYIPEHEHNEFKEYFQKSLRGEKITKEKHIFSDEFGDIWLDISYRPVLDDNNEIFAVAYSSVNTTYKKRTEQAILQSEKKFRLLFENMSNGFALTEAVYDEDNKNIIDFRLLLINRALKEILPTDANWLNKTITEVFGQKDKKWFDIFYQVATKDKRFQLEQYYKSVDRYFEVSLYSPQAGQVATIYNDVTERKRVEEILRKSEKDFKSLIDSSPDGIIVTDTNGKIEIVNPSLLQMLQIKSKRASVLLGNSCFNIIHPDERTKAETSFHLIVNNPNSLPYQSMETRLKTSSNRYIYTESSARPIIENDQVKRVIISIRDINQRKNAEQALRKREEQLKKLNATKDKFFSIIAHDLKNPFNNLIGFSEMLMHNFTNLDPDKLHEYIGLLNESANQGYNLLDNLLHWAGSQTGNLPFTPRIVKLSMIAEETVQLLKTMAENKEITVDINIDNDKIAYADINMISTVLRNLVSNALKFTHKNGYINIFTKDLGEYIQICVKDNGIGIPEEIQGKLFRIDQNVSSVGTNDEEGTGLGLILCKEFVEKHGGKINVKSKLGEGCEFFFSLPKTKSSVIDGNA